jgi:hypothetical protein
LWRLLGDAKGEKEGQKKAGEAHSGWDGHGVLSA